MEASTASAIFSAIAILISVFGSVRVARASSLIQQWTYRQKVGEELLSLSNLLTQSQLISQREQYRNDLIEREAKRLLLRAPNDLRLNGTLEAVTESRVMAENKLKSHAETRNTIAGIWQSDRPTADQLATVQQLKASIQHELLQLQALEQQQEDLYKQFMKSAATVP